MPIIEVEHVTKEFRLGQLTNLKQTALNTLNRLTGRPVQERKPFKALDDVSFSIEQGEVVGIIGHNGAGKSTLLKMLANISKPTSGSVTVKGKVAPLIEVGAGLIGDLTGRENIYLNASILGISRKEIDSKFDEIVAFAELEEFIDTPVKRYSSGMQVRLGFAIATSVESDILIVDEVLAVGDLAFQRKCFDRMEELIKYKGRTVLLVSHNIRQVERICDRVLLLDHGRLGMDGDSSLVCNEFYHRSDNKILENTRNTTSRLETTGDVELLEFVLLGSNGQPTNRISVNDSITLLLTFKAHTSIIHPMFGIGIHTTDFIYLATSDTYDYRQTTIPPGVFSITCHIRSFPFLTGSYAFRVGVHSGEVMNMLFYIENLHPFIVNPLPNISRNLINDMGFIALNTVWGIPNYDTQNGDGMPNRPMTQEVTNSM